MSVLFSLFIILSGNLKNAQLNSVFPFSNIAVDNLKLKAISKLLLNSAGRASKFCFLATIFWTTSTTGSGTGSPLYSGIITEGSAVTVGPLYSGTITLEAGEVGVVCSVLVEVGPELGGGVVLPPPAFTGAFSFIVKSPCFTTSW